MQNTVIFCKFPADDLHPAKSLLQASLTMRLSPAELSYLYASLTADPPLRPDLRALTTYRPRSLQTDFLCTANGSARITWMGGDVLVVVKAQIGDAVEVAPSVFGGQVFVDVYRSLLLSLVPPLASVCLGLMGSDGDEDSSAFLVETMTALLSPRQFGSYGINLRSLAITETKAWHIWIDCVVSLNSNRCI